MSEEHVDGISRRQFHRSALGVSAIGLGSVAYAGGSSNLRAAWIGLGRQGSRDIRHFLSGGKGVKLVALADVLPDRIAKARKMLDENHSGDKVDITDDDCYVGFDAYKKVLARDDVDFIIQTTPPGFRPQHVEAAIDAGKHVFCEKPGATDPPGLRQLRRAGEKAKKKGLSIVVGTQRRRMSHYNELINRVRDGAIGDILAADITTHIDYAHWHYHDRKPEWSDMEWQIRCWPFFVWLGGDHVVEHAVHWMDVVNWVIGTPENCLSRGGRIARTGKRHGNKYDHFSGIFDYGNELRAYHSGSQIQGASAMERERFYGTKGLLYLSYGRGYITGENAYEWDGPKPDGEEFARHFQILCSAIRNDEPVNEAHRLVQATAMSMTEREGAYTGQKVGYDWLVNTSRRKLVWPEEKHRMGPLEVRPVRIPGKTRLR